MTELEIDCLESGILTDKLVATHIFDWHYYQSGVNSDSCLVCGRPESNYQSPISIKHLGVQAIPPYSNMIHASWTAMKFTLQTGWTLLKLSKNQDSNFWHISVEKETRDGTYLLTASGENEHLAICKIVLKVKFLYEGR